MTYAEAIQYLHGLQMFGMRPGLENARFLAGMLGHPEARLQFIHVAGTNGKGSVCAMLESIYRHSGRRVGLFTSPHLVSFTERIQVQRETIPESDVARRVEQISAVLGSGIHTVTFFEAVTAVALAHFAEQRCDVVIWETGLGGRLDATNIVTPLASVITNIELDHQQWLGSTHDQIAAEKAGIIKPGRPVITAALPGRGLEVIAETARTQGCALTVVGDLPPEKAKDSGRPIRVLPENEVWRAVAGSNAPPILSLRGAHQRTNAAVAAATVLALAADLPVANRSIHAGLESASWPGRMQLIRGPGGGRILLDGAHNAAGAQAFRDAWSEEFPAVRPTLILGLLADKDWESVARLLAPLACRILAVPVNSQRGLPPEALLPACRAANPAAPVESCPSVQEALTKSGSDPFVVIIGSLYLIGEAMEVLKLMALPAADERGLNEWGGAPVSRGSSASSHVN